VATPAMWWFSDGSSPWSQVDKPTLLYFTKLLDNVFSHYWLVCRWRFLGHVGPVRNSQQRTRARD